jgi:hypothetical protein
MPDRRRQFLNYLVKELQHFAFTQSIQAIDIADQQAYFLRAQPELSLPTRVFISSVSRILLG